MADYYCKDCGTVGSRRRIYRGHALVSLLLWALPLWQLFTVLRFEWQLALFRAGTVTVDRGTFEGSKAYLALQTAAANLDAHYALVALSLGVIFLLAVPGIIYSAWRHMTAVNGCGKCRSAAVIPADTPAAQAAVAAH